MGQVRTKAREFYVQTCGGGKKDKSPQALTIATALPARNAAGGKRTWLTFLVFKRPGEIKKGRRREPKQGQAKPPPPAGSAPPAHSRAKGINAAYVSHCPGREGISGSFRRALFERPGDCPGWASPLCPVPPMSHPPQARRDRGLLLRQGPESRSLTHEVRAQDELLQQREALLELVGAHVHGHAARPRAPSAAMRSHALPPRRWP